MSYTVQPPKAELGEVLIDDTDVRNVQLLELLLLLLLLSAESWRRLYNVDGLSVIYSPDLMPSRDTLSDDKRDRKESAPHILLARRPTSHADRSAHVLPVLRSFVIFFLMVIS